MSVFSFRAGSQPSARPELRAFWADAFSPAFKSPEEADLLLKRVHDAHMNAVFVQMRKGGDAYYASHYEPWAKDAQSRFDSLAYLIEKAHAMSPRIAVHAWINTCAVGGNGSNPYNIVRLHPDWLSLNPDNKDFDNEATKIDPGNPGAADWTFRIYLDVARHYDVDGIHFDFVRYGDKEWGYNPASLDRFERSVIGGTDIKRLPNSKPDPSDETWKQWRRDQVTNLVRKTSLFAKRLNPQVVVSAAVITWGDAPKNDAEWMSKTAAMNRVYQDWQGWLKEGFIDLACPMTYFQSDYHLDWQKNWSRFIKAHQYQRAATIAVGTWFNTIPQSLEMMQDAREKSPDGKTPYGVMLYCYTGTNAGEKDAAGKRPELEYSAEFYEALSKPGANAPFQSDVPIPSMRWKTEPKSGHLKGYVLTSSLDPVDGAKVEILAKGKRLTRMTDGTGFYGFVDLPPGSCSIDVSYPGFAPVRKKAVVTVGKVTAENIRLGVVSPATVHTIQDLISSETADGLPLAFEKLTVVLGSDTYPGNFYAQDDSGNAIRIRLKSAPELPFQRGDVVSVIGTLRTVDQEKSIDGAKAVLVDMIPESELKSRTPFGMQPKDLTAAGRMMSISGEVTKADPEKFIVSWEGTEVEIPLAGHKDFGVEDLSFRFPIPSIGSKVTLEGFMSVGVLKSGNQEPKKIFRLHLIGSKGYGLLKGNALMERIGVGGIVAGVFHSSHDAFSKGEKSQ